MHSAAPRPAPPSRPGGAPAGGRGASAPDRELAALARRVRRLPPSCGPVRLVGVDGHAGSGKTTFAGRLAAVLDGAPVVHLDDLATHAEPFGWVGRLREQVLDPFTRGHPARHGVYDWVAARFGGVREVPAAPVVLLEGVGAGRRAVRPLLALLVWMDLSTAAARARGEARDGPALADFWRGWAAAEHAHFAADPSLPRADVLVDGVTGRIRAAGPSPAPLDHGRTGGHGDRVRAFAADVSDGSAAARAGAVERHRPADPTPPAGCP